MTTYTATYSPEDNKLRLYASTRLDAETFARIKEAGFRWAPRQGLFVAPSWSPRREDILIELAGEIEMEEMTLAERAAAKAERLETLAAKRHSQANAYARRADELSEAFYMGQPILVGHHSEGKARRTQAKMHAASDKAAAMHRAANYWQDRAAGVEWFANMKNDPRTRRNRIKTLLAELRDLQRDVNNAHKALKVWEKLTTDEQTRWAAGNMDARVTLVAMGDYWALEKGEKTPQEVRTAAIARAESIINGPNRRRCIDHTLNRLAYERDMLGDVPRYTGELTPVILQAFAREHGADKPKASETDPGSFQLESPVPLPLHLASGNVLDMVADDWRDLMQSVGYEVPAAKPRKASAPQAAPVINLTEAQAEQLQRIWNLRGCRKMIGGRPYTFKPREVCAVTQAVYSANSKGGYAPLETIELDAEGRRVVLKWERMERVRSAEPVARIRVKTTGGELYGPIAVCRLTDKPGKPLPIDLDRIEREAEAEAAAFEKERAA